MLGNAQDMPIITDVIDGPPEGIPINSTDVEMEEGNFFKKFTREFMTCGDIDYIIFCNVNCMCIVLIMFNIFVSFEDNY